MCGVVGQGNYFCRSLLPQLLGAPGACTLLRTGTQAGTVIVALGHISWGKYRTMSNAAFPSVSVNCPVCSPRSSPKEMLCSPVWPSAIFVPCGRACDAANPESEFVLQFPTWNTLIYSKSLQRGGYCHKPLQFAVKHDLQGQVPWLVRLSQDSGSRASVHNR